MLPRDRSKGCAPVTGRSRRKSFQRFFRLNPHKRLCPCSGNKSRAWAPLRFQEIKGGGATKRRLPLQRRRPRYVSSVLNLLIEKLLYDFCGRQNSGRPVRSGLKHLSALRDPGLPGGGNSKIRSTFCSRKHTDAMSGACSFLTY